MTKRIAESVTLVNEKLYFKVLFLVSLQNRFTASKIDRFVGLVCYKVSTTGTLEGSVFDFEAFFCGSGDIPSRLIVV